MPQSERSDNIKKLAKWLRAKSKRKGATRREIHKFVKVEVTEMGATDGTIKKYIDDLVQNGFIQINGIRYKTTTLCENWLDRKLSS